MSRPTIATLILSVLAASSILHSASRTLAASGDADALRAAREVLADRDYAAAIERLQAFRREYPDSPLAGEGELLLARASQLQGRHEAALASLQDFLQRNPGSPFAAKARLLMADAYLSLQRFSSAASIYRTRLEFLRGDAYRDRIAGYYLEIADPAYAGRSVQDPSTLIHREIIQHDYQRALEYYRKALSAMGRGELRAGREDEIRYRIGRSLLELNKPADAIRELTALLEEPKKRLEPGLLGEVLFALGRSHGKAGNFREAIQAYGRIEDELGDHPLAPESIQAIGSLELQRAGQGDEKARKAAFRRAMDAFGRFLKKHPQHTLAPQVAYAAGDARAKAGDREGALARFRELIEQYPKDERAPTAQLRIADLLRQDHHYDRAVSEWKKFLGTYPSDSRWSQAQENIEEALYHKGLHLLREEKKPAEARSAWEEFLSAYPTSSLAPEVYRRFYEMDMEKKEHRQAAGSLRRLVEKYPRSKLAPSSALLLARLFQGPLDDLEGAIREYEALLKKFPKSGEAREAQAMLSRMRRKELELIAPRVYHTGEPWTLRVKTRNIPRLKFKAYRVNLEEYFRKKLAVEGIEEVAVRVVEPTRSWEHEVGQEEKSGYRAYRLFDGERELPLPAGEAGAYIITAEEEVLQAVVLAVRSDLQVITKASPRQTFLWAFDEKSGKPRGGVKVLLADPGGVFFEGETDGEGVLSVEHDRVRQDVRVLALERGKEKGSVHYATEKTRAPAEVAYGYTTKVHIATDRPLYRPLQRVHFRAILRKVVEGRYQSSEGEKARCTITNPLGVVLYEEDLVANEFGAAAGSVELTEEPPLGEYRIQVSYQKQTFTGKFKVEEYRKPEFSVSLKTERPAYLRGEEVRGKIRGEYLFGGPVPRARVTWRVFEGPYAFDAGRFQEYRWFFSPSALPPRSPRGDGGVIGGWKFIAQGSGETDEKGETPFRFQPVSDGRDHTYRIQLEAADISRVTVSGVEDVLVTGQEVYVVARTGRKVYRPGDRVPVSFRTVDAASRPVDVKGEVILARRVRGEGGQSFDREVERVALATAGGKGEAVVQPKEPGEYRLLFRTTDRGGNLCEGGTPVHVAGEEPDLAREARFLFEKAVYHQGEEARLFLSSPAAGRHALVTFEADRVIDHRVIPVESRSLELPVTMEGKFSPNITASVAIPEKNRLYSAKDEAIVLQFLDVEVRSEKGEYGPGDEVKLEVVARDQRGRPREAEFSLAVIDSAILQLQPELVEPVKPFFYDQRRAHAVRTASSYGFHYSGTTSNKPSALLAEEERRLVEQAKKLEERTRSRRGGRASTFAAPAAPAAIVEKALKAYTGKPGSLTLSSTGAGGSGGYGGRAAGSEFGVALGGEEGEALAVKDAPDVALFYGQQYDKSLDAKRITVDSRFLDVEGLPLLAPPGARHPPELRRHGVLAERRAHGEGREGVGHVPAPRQPHGLARLRHRRHPRQRRRDPRGRRRDGLPHQKGPPPPHPGPPLPHPQGLRLPHHSRPQLPPRGGGRHRGDAGKGDRRQELLQYRAPRGRRRHRRLPVGDPSPTRGPGAPHRPRTLHKRVRCHGEGHSHHPLRKEGTGRPGRPSRGPGPHPLRPAGEVDRWHRPGPGGHLPPRER